VCVCVCGCVWVYVCASASVSISMRVYACVYVCFALADVFIFTPRPLTPLNTFLSVFSVGGRARGAYATLVQTAWCATCTPYNFLIGSTDCTDFRTILVHLDCTLLTEFTFLTTRNGRPFGSHI
jgi:hypothetical protein